MSWYRKYRPTTVAGLHLESVRTTLQRMMAKAQFPHALLFAGPKGTGKTSAARIIGAMLNDPANAATVEAMFLGEKTSGQMDGKIAKSAAAKLQPLHEPNPQSEIVQRIQRGSSFVVNELDAASNRGIDDIRQLRERTHLPPQEGLITLYILDEVHMLTTEAFNALLKILEEPPAHVVFILATTELHKIPDTIISRCTVVQFQKASHDELFGALEHILKQEGIGFEKAALDEVVQAADGSFRDGVKMLEMLAAGEKELTLARAREALHQTNRQQLLELIQAILHKDEKQVSQFFANLRQENADPNFFHKALLSLLHEDLLLALGVSGGEEGGAEGTAKAEFSPKISHYLLTQFSSIKTDATQVIPFLALELKALELVFKSKEKAEGTGGSMGGANSSSGKKSDNTQSVEPSGRTIKSASTAPVASVAPIAKVAEVSVVYQAASEITEEIAQEIEIAIEPEPEIIAEPFTETLSETQELQPKSASAQELIENWEKFLEQVHLRNSSIEALLRSSKPISADGEKAKIEVYYQFHREQLQQPKFLQMLQECVQNVLGGNVFFEFTLALPAKLDVLQPNFPELTNLSAKVDEDDSLIKLAKEMLV